MALIKCPECGRENVSDSAEACPNCGFGIKGFCVQQRNENERIAREEKIAQEKQEQQKRLDSVELPHKPHLKRRTLIYGLFAVIFVVIGDIICANAEQAQIFGVLLLALGIVLLYFTISEYSTYSEHKRDYDFAKRDLVAYKQKKVEEKYGIPEYEKPVEIKPDPIHCPQCGSINTERISTASRAVCYSKYGQIYHIEIVPASTCSSSYSKLYY